jgi:hypothetical protein
MERKTRRLRIFDLFPDALPAALECVVCVASLSIGPVVANAAAAPKPNQVEVAYRASKNPEHQQLSDTLKQHGVLEELQKLVSPIRLPRKLTLQLASCDGEANAFYEADTVQICYELVQEIRSDAPKETTPAGIEPIDALVGPFAFVFLHEIGHALFDMLQVPLFGREEDAADQLAAYEMLQLDRAKARRLIAGAAYLYKNDLQSEIKVELREFSDQHGLPAQRFYNLLCIAYGADGKLFGDFVEKGYLPKERSESCAAEYDQVVYAFDKLIAPYIDRALALKLRAQRWIRTVTTRRPPSSRRQPAQ